MAHHEILSNDSGTELSTNEPPITRSDLRQELGLLRDELRAHYATKEDVANLRADIEVKFRQFLQWTIMAMLVAAGAASSVVLAIEKVVGE